MCQEVGGFSYLATLESLNHVWREASWEVSPIYTPIEVIDMG